ncbi:MAG: NrfD/PsrC family molybdoenzyme membrane anchor subunit [Chloroflexota bacterium]
MAYERRWETRGEGRRRGGRSAGDAARASYYGLPAIKQPHWKWLIIAYFFLGGITSASYVVASIASLFGDADHRRIARAGRYLSFAALIPCPILLILDLGRPERFLYMLRILKLRSPMSVGTWGLVVFSAFSTLSALVQASRDGIFGRSTLPARLLRALPARVIGVVGLAPAFFVGGYTGVLLAATAVPLWTKNYLLMGPLFLSSAMSTATAAIALILSLTRSLTRDATGHRALRRLERLDCLALGAELLLMLAVRANAGPVIGHPVLEGRLSRLYRVGVLGLGVLVPLAIQSTATFAGKDLPPLATAAASALVLAGGFTLRYVMVLAGRASADDPQATFELAQGGNPQFSTAEE